VVEVEQPGRDRIHAARVRRAAGASPKSRPEAPLGPYERSRIHLKRAVITAEDARFAEHVGVDWEAIQKAYKDNQARRAARWLDDHAAAGQEPFPVAERSYLRKGQELVIAYMIEASWDKRRILEVYLNVVEWGEGVFGAEAAARHYYGRARLPAQRRAGGAARRLPAQPEALRPAEGRPYLDRRTAAILRYMPDAATVPRSPRRTTSSSGAARARLQSVGL
jgi:monofunctional glycosyltransferase